MKSRFPDIFDITIEKLVTSGEGLGYYQSRPIYVFGVMPEDQVRVRPVKVRRRITQAALVDVLKPAPCRTAARDDHYLSSSPWQIMPIDQQRAAKQSLVWDLFAPLAGFPPSIMPRITGPKEVWHYRNKMEYCFTEDDSGRLRLGIHQRGRFNRYYSVTSSAVAHQRINACAQEVLEALRRNDIQRTRLKYLIMRYSYAEDQCLAILYVTDECFPAVDLAARNLAGWLIIYSDPKTPAAGVTRILHQQGRDFLKEKVAGLQLKYYFDSFFQIYPAAFNEVITYLKGLLLPQGRVVDLYAGVGTMGFALAGVSNEVLSLEADERASQAAKENIAANRLDNVTLVQGLAEKQNLIEVLSGCDVLMVDPPRSGLHPRVVKAITAYGPATFIYVSCNPVTQAHDLALLKEQYRVSHWRLFDLYPQTPHVESIIVLERIGPRTDA